VNGRKKGIDECIGRGCGGLLRGVGSEVHDGELAWCASCRRQHTFHVAEDGGPVAVTIERKRKPRAARGER